MSYITETMAGLVTSERLEPIVYLSESAGIETDIDKLEQVEQRARHIYERCNVVPTIGCEVEVTFPSLYPDVSDRLFKSAKEIGELTTFSTMLQRLGQEDRAEYEEIDALIRPAYEETVNIGIPAGKDAYWEFANKPAHSWQVLAAEVDLLMAKGLIPIGYNHSMHVTLGGLDSTGGGPAMMLCGLELLSVPADRIRAGTRKRALLTMSGWARRQDADGLHSGLRPRFTNELELGATTATEFRTLTTSSPEDHHKSLRAAQLMGAILLAHRRQQEDATKPAISRLAELWAEYRQCIRDLWVANSLPVASWGSVHKNPDIWNAWADCLGRRHDDSSYESYAVEAINATLNEAEKAIAEL